MALYESKSTIKMCVKLANKRASNFDIHHCWARHLLTSNGADGIAAPTPTPTATQTTYLPAPKRQGEREREARTTMEQLELTANQNVAQSSLTTFSSQLSCQGGQHISATASRERGQREGGSRRLCLRFA